MAVVAGIAFAIAVTAAVAASIVTSIIPPEENPYPGFGDPDATKPGDTTTVPGTPGVPENTPGGTGPQTIPTMGDIAREQAGIQNLQTKQFQLSGANTILGMKGQTVQGVGAMRSRSAARNVDVTASPLYNIAVKERESEQQITMAGESLEQSVLIQGKVRDVGWNSFLLAGARELDQTAQQNADRWMNVFTDVLKIGIGFATGFPIPSFPSSVPVTPGRDPRPWEL